MVVTVDSSSGATKRSHIYNLESHKKGYHVWSPESNAYTTLPYGRDFKVAQKLFLAITTLNCA